MNLLVNPLVQTEIDVTWKLTCFLSLATSVGLLLAFLVEPRPDDRLSDLRWNRPLPNRPSLLIPPPWVPDVVDDTAPDDDGVLLDR